MMNKYYFIILFTICMVIIAYFYKFKSVETLTYFPADDKVTFTNSETSLTFTNDNKLNWYVWSNSDQPTYLRQDISIIYKNGKFKDVMNKWEQQTDKIILNEIFHHDGNKFYDTISFHHGEVQYDDQHITSIQKMSHDYLYVYQLKNKYNAFKNPHTKYEKEIKNKLNQTNSNELTLYWNKLINYYDINQDDYLPIPLTSLMIYESTRLPNLSEQKTKRVLGQLWEGLYKNYIIPISNNKTVHTPHLMPLILFAKDGSHLYVLFELNGEKMILLQQI